jgi:hypothetical protein
MSKLMDKETEKRLMDMLHEENNQLVENTKKVEMKYKLKKIFEELRENVNILHKNPKANDSYAAIMFMLDGLEYFIEMENLSKQKTFEVFRSLEDRIDREDQEEF